MIPPFEVEEWMVVADSNNNYALTHAKVNELLTQGWVLWGPPYSQGKYNSRVAQALIKPKVIEVDIEPTNFAEELFEL